MSFFGMNVAGSALAAFQQAANTTSDDIANVNTPGASRQTVNLSEAAPIVGSPGYATWSGPGTLYINSTTALARRGAACGHRCGHRRGARPDIRERVQP